MKGKYAIHPDQVAAINKGFSPSAADIAQAEKIIEAFERSAARGAGATSVDGRMVDAPVVARARAVIAASRRR
jgi:citrate lyase subunit beta/citryl-CoA lyase